MSNLIRHLTKTCDIPPATREQKYPGILPSGNTCTSPNPLNARNSSFMALKVQDSRGEMGSPIFQRCQLSLLAPFIPGTSLTLPNKQKGAHKSDSAEIDAPPGHSPSISTSQKYTNFSSRRKFNVSAPSFGARHSWEQPECCLLLLSSSPEPPTMLPVRSSSPGFPPSCW